VLRRKRPAQRTKPSFGLEPEPKHPANRRDRRSDNNGDARGRVSRVSRLTPRAHEESAYADGTADSRGARQVMLGAVAAADARGQDDFGTGVPGIVSFSRPHRGVPCRWSRWSASSRSSWDWRSCSQAGPIGAQLTPVYPESGLRRTTRHGGRFRGSTEARTSIKS
jgi:hypothetical protein